MITKCLFPVAGYGTRFLPATKSMPKEMLPVVNKPLVQYGVEEAIEAGMLNCALVTGRGKRAIADHFDISYELEHQIAGSEKEQYSGEYSRRDRSWRFYHGSSARNVRSGPCNLDGRTLDWRSTLWRGVV